MSANDKTVTERVAVLRERKAFMAGAHWRFSAVIAKDWKAVASIGDEVYRQGAAQYAPLPTVTRPRVVRLPGDNLEWSLRDNHLRARTIYSGVSRSAGEWMSAREFMAVLWWADSAPLPERVALWAELLANPTEEVEAES